jgi:hypothetical protein
MPFVPMQRPGSPSELPDALLNSTCGAMVMLIDTEPRDVAPRLPAFAAVVAANSAANAAAIVDPLKQFTFTSRSRQTDTGPKCFTAALSIDPIRTNSL